MKKISKSIMTKITIDYDDENHSQSRRLKKKKNNATKTPSITTKIAIDHDEN